MSEVLSIRWLSLPEACRYASMGETTMIKHLRAGHIKGSKRGKWYVDRLSVDRFLSGDDPAEELFVAKLIGKML